MYWGQLEMKRTVLIFLLCILCFGAGYSTSQSTSTFAIQWSTTGATQQEANQNLARFGASALVGAGVDADVWQRNPDGSVKLDVEGRRLIAPAKVAPALKAFLTAKVQEWAEQGDIGELSAIQTQAVVNQVKAKPTPAVQ
jgi:hypothetical protein